MVMTSKQAELDMVMATAKAMCAAARTAPKTQGKDYLETCIVTGEEMLQLADRMEEIGTKMEAQFLCRDAGNLRNSTAIVLIAARNAYHGINELCQYCGFQNCGECTKAGGICAFTPMDLGIAVGSAVAIAADCRVDNRVMFSAGRAAKELDFFGAEYTEIIGIPLSISGKSPYYDRKKST